VIAVGDAEHNQENSQSGQKLSIEEQRLKQDRELKEMELELRRKELHIFRNPISIAIIALAGTLLVNTIQQHTAESEQHIKAQNELALEQARARANLILESIRTGDTSRAAVNLRFLIRIGVLVDPDHKIMNALDQDQGPVLPAGMQPLAPIIGPTIHVYDRTTRKGIKDARVRLHGTETACPPTDVNGDSQPCDLPLKQRVDVSAFGYVEVRDMEIIGVSIGLTPVQEKGATEKRP